MELHLGICGICDAGNEVINPKDSGTFWETICRIFKDKFDNLMILQPHLKICLTCIFHANLIDIKKNILKKLISNVDATGINRCRFCKNNNNLLKIENSAIFETSESGQTSRANEWSITCAYCYYVIKANYCLKSNLSIKLSEYINTASIPPDGLHSIKTEICSDDESSNLSKSRKNLSDGNNEKSTKKNEIDGDVLTSNNYSHRNRKGKMKNEKNMDINTEQSSISYEIRRTSKRKCSTSPNQQLAKKIKKTHVHANKANGLDMSRVSCLMPLCKTNIVVNAAIKQDTKFYNFVPYVDLSIMKASENLCSDLPQHKSKQMMFASPVGIIKRTPPIKIKLKKITKLKKGIMDKKHAKKKLTKDKSPPNTTMFGEFERKKVVVKVERMVIQTDDEEVPSQFDNAESEPSIVSYVSVLKDTSVIDVTPKKKKKVHFNDTPTIIITADNLSEDSANEEENISKGKSTRNGKTVETKEESVEENYTFDIDSDESDDAMTIQDDTVEDNVRKSIKEEDNKNQNVETCNIDIMEIDLSDNESEQLEYTVQDNVGKSINKEKNKSQNVETDNVHIDLDLSENESEQVEYTVQDNVGKSIKKEKKSQNVETGNVCIELDLSENESEQVEYTVQDNVGKSTKKEKKSQNVEADNVDIELDLSENESEQFEYTVQDNAGKSTKKEKNKSQNVETNNADIELDSSGNELEESNDHVKENVRKSINDEFRKTENKKKGNVEVVDLEISDTEENKEIDKEEENKEVDKSEDELEQLSAIKQANTITSCKNTDDEAVELKNTEHQDSLDNEKHISEENVVKENIEGEKENSLFEETNVKEKNEPKEKYCAQKTKKPTEENTIELKNMKQGSQEREKQKFGGENEEEREKSLHETNVKEKYESNKKDLDKSESTLIEDSDDEETLEKITACQIDNHCRAESEEMVKDGNESTEVCSKNDDKKNEKKKEDEPNVDEIVVNDIVLSEANTEEDFGSLIDEVQKCLTSSADESSENMEKINDSSDESDDSNLLSCLNDIDKDIDNTLPESFLSNIKMSNLKNDKPSVDNKNDRKLSSERHTSKKTTDSPNSSDL